MILPLIFSWRCLDSLTQVSALAHASLMIGFQLHNLTISLTDSHHSKPVWSFPHCLLSLTASFNWYYLVRVSWSFTLSLPLLGQFLYLFCVKLKNFYSSETSDAVGEVPDVQNLLSWYDDFDTSYTLLLGELPEEKEKHGQHCAEWPASCNPSFAKRKMGSYCSWKVQRIWVTKESTIQSVSYFLNLYLQATRKGNRWCYFRWSTVVLLGILP